MAILGLIIILGVNISYLTMLFVLHRFTYRTWMFDIVVGAGMIMGASSWFQEGGSWLSWITITLGIIWFLVSRIELRIVGSKELNLRVGDTMPAMAFVKTDGMQMTEQDLIANAPALLTLYRGWWCPSSKVQLHAILEQNEHLVVTHSRVKRNAKTFRPSADLFFRLRASLAKSNAVLKNDVPYDLFDSSRQSLQRLIQTFCALGNRN